MSGVIFLGAGASKAFGYPTTVEFMETAKQRSLPDPFKEIVNYIQPKRKTVDIEMVLGDLQDLQSAIQELRVPGHFKEWLFLQSGHVGNPNQLVQYSRNISMLISEINKLVYDTYWKEPSEEAKATYRELASHFAPSLDIFTTNYDLCVEHAFVDDSVDDKSFTDGFGYINRSIRWDESLFDGSNIRLYKLHGSVNWKRSLSGDLWKTPVHDRTEEKDHVILYPGFKGEPSAEPFIFVHRALAEKLASSRSLIVIGFSFRDEYINRIINGAIKKERGLRLVIWNPVLPAHPFPNESVVLFDKPFERIHIQEVANLIS